MTEHAPPNTFCNVSSFPLKIKTQLNAKLAIDYTTMISCVLVED